MQGEAHLQRVHHERGGWVRLAAVPVRPGGLHLLLHPDVEAGFVLRQDQGERGPRSAYPSLTGHSGEGTERRGAVPGEEGVRAASVHELRHVRAADAGG